MGPSKNIEIVQPHRQYDTIRLQNFGRRPTTIHDLRGLLSLIAQVKGNVCEIGAWYGKSTFEIASRFPKKTFHTVDFIEIELEYEIAMKTRAQQKEDICKYAKHLPNVNYHYINSKDFDYTGKDIRIIFIDGDHSYEGVKADTDKALDNFKTKKGIICWHDSRNGTFGVPHYLRKEIDPFHKRYMFDRSQLSYIYI